MSYARYDFEAPKEPGARVIKIWPMGRAKQFSIMVVDERTTGEEGRLVWKCRSCQRPTSRGNAKFCSDACRSLFKTLFTPYTWERIRNAAIQRDGGRCVNCGASPGDVPEPPRTPSDKDPESWEAWRDAVHEHDRRARAVQLEVDHIVPVYKDPMREFDLDNVRTLCHACHARLGARPGRRSRPTETTTQASLVTS